MRTVISEFQGEDVSTVALRHAVFCFPVSRLSDESHEAGGLARGGLQFLHDGFARVLRAITLALERGMLDWANLVAGEGLRRKGSDAT